MTYTHLSSKQRLQIQGLTKAVIHLSPIALWWRTQVHASTRALATVGTPYVAPAPDRMPDQLRGGQGQQVLRRLTAVGQRVLVISPHGLDVALGCGGAMARHANLHKSSQSRAPPKREWPIYRMCGCGMAFYTWRISCVY